MHEAAVNFHRRAARALDDAGLQRAMRGAKGKFMEARARAAASVPDFESLREEGRRIREYSVNNLAALLEEFEKNAEARGAKVLWAKDAAAARRLVCAIAAAHNIKRAVKSKSMLSEEIALNGALEKEGVEVTETDLGEYIIQLAAEPPSHIIAPALHKTADDVRAIFKKQLGAPPEEMTDAASITRFARRKLREKFLAADAGISGANFLIADTGSTLLVSNEGNARLCATLPPVHITVVGVEKIVPSWRCAATMMALLPRSATGQSISNYVTLNTGAGADENENEGPRHAYIVLVDNGRSRIARGAYKDALRCIRCGACMNHCPVYAAVGGHAYGSVYMGPIGQVLSPLLFDGEQHGELPHAATMCGACAVVCPVKIPLPNLMRRLREDQARRGARPLS